MDPLAEEPLDYGDDHHQPAAAAIPAIAEDDDEFDDLYNDVNVGDHFSSLHQTPKPSNPTPNPDPDPNANAKPNPNPNPTPLVSTDQNPNFNHFRVHNLQQQGNNTHVRDQAFQSAKVPIAHSPAPTSAPRPVVGPVDANGPTMLFVGELHWWTTDADLESVLTRYGRVKEIKIFDERASGKSKGYCQVEFFEAAAAAACKEGMDGYVFNGRACVVAFVSPQTLRQMGASYVNRNQNQGSMQQQQGGRRGPMNDGMGRGGNGGDNGGGRGFGRGGWGGGRGQGMMGRGQGVGVRGRGFISGKNVMGNNAPYGQGMGVPSTGMMHPQNMMGAGFDPTFMGRGGPFGGFGGPAFTGMMPPFQAMNVVGLPGVAPHVNLAFFGRGMPTNGMGVIGGSGMEGQMWGDGNMGGAWNGDDDGASEHGYGEANNERGGRSNTSREKDRGLDHEFSGNSDRRRRGEDQDWDRSDRERNRDEKDGYRDYRSRDRDYDNEVDWDRGQSSSRSRSKSWIPEDDQRSRSRDADYGRDYGKRRRE